MVASICEADALSPPHLRPHLPRWGRGQLETASYRVWTVRWCAHPLAHREIPGILVDL